MYFSCGFTCLIKKHYRPLVVRAAWRRLRCLCAKIYELLRIICWCWCTDYRVLRCFLWELYYMYMVSKYPLTLKHTFLLSLNTPKMKYIINNDSRIYLHRHNGRQDARMPYNATLFLSSSFLFYSAFILLRIRSDVLLNISLLLDALFLKSWNNMHLHMNNIKFTFSIMPNAYQTHSLY